MGRKPYSQGRSPLGRTTLLAALTFAAATTLILFPGSSPAADGPTAVLASSPTPATGKAPLLVTFDGSGSSDSDAPIDSWTLDFGDGSSDTGTGPPPSSDSHTYAAGMYTATLTITDDNDATDSASVSVTANANVPPTAVLKSTPTPATGPAPLNVTFDGSASSDSDGSIASWKLDFGDGTTVASGSGLPPSSLPHTYAAGTYTAVLTVTDDSGATDTDSVKVNADAPPTASLAADQTSGPIPLAVKFDGSGSSDSDGSIAAWALNFGDGHSTSGSGAVPSSIAHTYTSSCSCTASLTVTDNQGAQSTPATLVIHANTNQPPVAILNATPTSGTVPLAVSFDGSASNDPDNILLKSWSLDFGDGNSTSGTGAVPNAIPHTYMTAGTYNAKLTVTDSSNASTTSTPFTITVNPQPSISVANVSQNEGNSGTTNLVFVAKLSAVSTHDVTVDYATADGTATAGSDYTATSGTLKIPANTDCSTNPAGKTACQIDVPVIGDTIYENDETFTLNLSNPTGATLANTSATGTIVNDDQPPWVEIENGATLEGNTGSVVGGAQSWSAGGNLQLSDASGFPSSDGVHTFYISTPGAAAIGGPYKYTGLSGNTLTGVSPAGSVVVGQIAFQPRFITLPVVLCDPQKSPDKNPADCVATTSGLDTTAHYATSNGQSLTTAIPVIEGQDYVAASGTVTIPAGNASGSITFETIPNTTPENPSNPGDDLTRWFNVLLTNPTNSTIASNLGIATIIEDDGLNPPTASTGNASSIGTDHATVSATVNPKGDATQVYVQYGPTDSYGSQTAPQSLAAGTTDQTLSFPLTGLSAGTPYHYQVVATHADHSTGYGQDKTFTTDAAPTAVLKASPTSGPVPLPVTFNGSGSSDRDGSIVSWTLSFGDGKSTSGAGSVPSSIPHTYTSPCSPCIASLTVTDNQGGQSAPAKVQITVQKKISTPGGPELSDITTKVLGPTSAKIMVTVDPKGAESQIWIAYGTDTKYSDTSQAQRISAGAARRLTFPLTNLSAQTTYHFQVVAWHIAVDTGTTYSSDHPFKTSKTKPMAVAPKTRVVRATAKGIVPLRLRCGGNALPSCKGQALLELGNRAVGFRSFSIPKGRTKLVSVRLKKTTLSRLLASSGGLHLVLTISVRTGVDGAGLTTKRITVLPPKG